MKLEKHFPILDGAQETMAEILSVFVYENNIYMAVKIMLTDKVKLFQILPHGIKKAPNKILEEFMDEAKVEVGNGIG